MIIYLSILSFQDIFEDSYVDIRKRKAILEETKKHKFSV